MKLYTGPNEELLVRVEQIVLPVVRQIVRWPWLADALFRFDKWGNPWADEVHENPYPTLELMRADGAVSFRKMWQQWFVLGYDQARFVLSSDAFVSSAQIKVLMKVRPYNKLSVQAKEFWALWLVVLDPPDHTRLRRLVSHAFSPKRIAGLEPKIEALVDELIAEMQAEESPDVVAMMCRQLPVAVIAELLGLPRERWDWSRRTTEEMIKLLSPLEYFDPESVSDSIADMHEYWGSLADERLANPQDDLITALVEAEVEGDKLTRQELVAVVAVLMGAGHETTTNQFGNAIIALADNPDQRALVRNSPDLWPNAVEELLRFDTAFKASARAAIRDIEVDGQLIKAGANVLVQLPAANRDPARFDRPNELILDRDDPSPISFGHGAHHCFGAALARMELRIGLKKFVEAFGDYTVDTDSIEWKRSPSLRGPSRLVVTAGE